MKNGTSSCLFLPFLFVAATGCSTLISDVQQGDKEAVLDRLEGDVDVDERDDIGYTALLYAAELGHSEITRALIDYGADVISGTLVSDPETVLRYISQGASFRQIKRGKGVKLLTLIKEGLGK